MGKSRVPRTIPEFRDYLNNSDDYLFSLRGGTLVYVLLGLLVANANEWHIRRVYFRDTLFPLYSNENTRTTTVIHQVQNFMKSFFIFSKPLLNIMAASPNAIEADETALNFKISRKNPSKPTTPINKQCHTLLVPKTGGKMKASSRTSTDATRSSVPEDALGVQYAYKIGGTPPADVDDGTQKEFLSGSMHTLSFGTGNVGKKFYIYSRWFNPTYPQFAGPWSDLQTGGVA
jgi:hypothetical protein